MLNKVGIKNHIDAQLITIRKYWSQYIIAALEDSGLLTDIDVLKGIKDLKSQLDNIAEKALENVEKKSKEIIGAAKKEADKIKTSARKIETSARKTAQKISVQEAQTQFKEAAEGNVTQIYVWGGISIVLIIAFVLFVWYLLAGVTLPEVWNWTFIYYSIIRLGVLALISTILGFSIKMLRANLHMHQHNLHRKRIANSMASFAESATNEGQRDLILTQLVESVSNFGNSGMITNEGEKSGISIDSIGKTVSNIKGDK